MSFPRYPAYKDSGVEWLGEVPAHWKVMPLVRDIEFITSGARGWAENYSDDGDLFIRIGNLTRDSIKLDLSDVQRVVVPAGAEVDRTQVREGDVLFSITAYLGSVAVVPPDLGKAFVSQHVALVRPTKRQCMSAWIGYVALSHVGKTHLETTGYGGTKVQLSLADVTTMPVLVPPGDEQSRLVGFLDRETAKIDALVAEQEQLITLLKEKRQAVISHAVTKGLDPSVPMKDSGVEWLGEVPEHWSAVRLKFLAADIKAGPFGSALTKDMYASSGYRVYGQEQVIPGDFSLGEYYIDEATLAQLAQYATQVGDVLISCVGTFGKIAVVPESAEPGIINPRLIRLRVVDDVSPNYLAEVLRSSVTFEQFSVLSRGGTMDVINIGTLSDIWVAVPPYSEQQSILEEWQRLMREFDALVDEAVLSIELLRERRSALISAAVTGQIDVRGLAQAVSDLVIES